MDRTGSHILSHPTLLEITRLHPDSNKIGILLQKKRENGFWLEKSTDCRASSRAPSTCSLFPTPVHSPRGAHRHLLSVKRLQQFLFAPNTQPDTRSSVAAFCVHLRPWSHHSPPCPGPAKPSSCPNSDQVKEVRVLSAKSALASLTSSPFFTCLVLS